MVDRVHQHGDAERVRQQDEFLRLSSHIWPVRVRNSMPYSHSFWVGRTSRTKAMQVSHQGFADFPDARIGCARDPPEYRVGDGVFVEVTQVGLR